MLRSQHRASPTDSARRNGERHSRGLLVFAVGGRQVAACMEEIIGVRPWPHAISVPSDTPFISALVRFESECMPVYELAARMNRTMESADALCLLVKHEDGPLAIRIDPTIPSLHVTEPVTVPRQAGGDPDIRGTCLIGEEEVSVIRLRRLGKECEDVSCLGF